jgi:hypothetical protein
MLGGKMPFGGYISSVVVSRHASLLAKLQTSCDKMGLEPNYTGIYQVDDQRWSHPVELAIAILRDGMWVCCWDSTPKRPSAEYLRVECLTFHVKDLILFLEDNYDEMSEYLRTYLPAADGADHYTKQAAMYLDHQRGISSKTPIKVTYRPI